MMVGRLLSFWDGIFSGAMLNFQGVVWWFKIIVLPSLLGRDYFHIHDQLLTGWDRDSVFFCCRDLMGFRTLDLRSWSNGFWTQQILKAREMRRHCHILPMFQTLLWAYINCQGMNDCMLQSMCCNGNFFVLHLETCGARGQNGGNHTFWLCNMRVTQEKMFVWSGCRDIWFQLTSCIVHALFFARCWCVMMSRHVVV